MTYNVYHIQVMSKHYYSNISMVKFYKKNISCWYIVGVVSIIVGNSSCIISFNRKECRCIGCHDKATTWGGKG